FGKSRGQRFLDQYIHTSFHQVARDGKMMNRGGRHRSGTDLAVRGQHLFYGSEAAAVELTGHGVGAVNVGIDHSNKAYSFALLFEFFVDTGVITSEDAYADYGNGDRILCWQRKILSGGCREEL